MSGQRSPLSNPLTPLKIAFDFSFGAHCQLSHDRSMSGRASEYKRACSRLPEGLRGRFFPLVEDNARPTLPFFVLRRKKPPTNGAVI
jgi:hypothetical protein